MRWRMKRPIVSFLDNSMHACKCAAYTPNNSETFDVERLWKTRNQELCEDFEQRKLEGCRHWIR